MKRLFLLYSVFLLVIPAYAGGMDIKAGAVSPDSLPAVLPFELNFDGPVSGTLADQNGNGTGFGTVVDYSGVRLPADGLPSDPAQPAYEPSRLTIEGGSLKVETNKGIAYLDNNNQLNMLAVKVDSRNLLKVEATLQNPYYGTQSQQAGVWFGLNDKTFVKLVVSGNKVELRRELDDVSGGVDYRKTVHINGLQNSTLRLRLVIDPVVGTAEGFYSRDGIDYLNVGAEYPVSSLSIAGMGLTDSTAYAGIQATHRYANAPAIFTFQDFSIRGEDAPPPSASEIKVNFQDPGTVPPEGWLRDYGQAYGPRTGQYQGLGLEYGWKRRSDGSPLNLAIGGRTPGNGRNRGIPADVLKATLMHMQADDIPISFNGTAVEGYWSIKVMNGVYDVTVSVGDADVGSAPELHYLDVEDVPAIVAFTPSGAAGSATRFEEATVRVTVSDGQLDIQADGGTNTKINSARIVPISTDPGVERPYVVASVPADGATDVSINTVNIVAIHLYVPEVPGYQGGVDNTTISSSTVKLLKLSGGSEIPVAGVVQGTGGGDAISFSPSNVLEPYTTYKFVITEGVASYSGAPFLPYEAVFTTGAGDTGVPGLPDVRFVKYPQPGTEGRKYTSLTFGPDGKLYALRLNGAIDRFVVDSLTGSLSAREVMNTLVNKYGTRSATGLVFDPHATASNLIAWVSHSSGGLVQAPEFDGNISRLSGPALENEELVITQLPRSMKDHMVNSMAFGPDSALYINQGANGSMGAYDPIWQREESLLSAAVLRLDMQKLSGVTLPLNVRTTSDQSLINSAPATGMTMADGTYNPYGSAAPLTLYASGVRNAYDLVWHTNGQLYVPTNGSGAGGATPASVPGTRRPDGTFYNGPVVPGTQDVQEQKDWLFRINPEEGIGYFGHPNPTRGEYVANNGYPDNSLYPDTIQTDANFRGAAYDFGLSKSPNGVIEYKSETFNSELKGKLLVCRFSGGGDIIILEPGRLTADPGLPPGADNVYDIVRAYTGSGTDGQEGMFGFVNPLDLTEDLRNGNLYVVEYNWRNDPNFTARITLLKVSEPDSAQLLARKINFQPMSSTVPPGYTADIGLPFDPGRGFGWIDPVTGTPQDQAVSMRDRNVPDSLQLKTFAQMQATTGGQRPGSWEYQLENGWYQVSVSAGDPIYYNSKHRINVEGVPAILDFVPSATDKFRRATVTVQVQDGRLSVDALGGTNTKINYVTLQPVAPPPMARKINFQPASSTIPPGYTADIGLPFDPGRGFGWIDPVTGTPQDQAVSMRDRNVPDSLQLKTFAQMQATTGGQRPGSWEYQLENGWYQVSVSAGDPIYYNSKHRINVEGVPAIVDFVPSAADIFRRATVTVLVQDGKLTVDASGGTNTKINYITIQPLDAPPVANATITVANLDGFPSADNLVFSRVQVPWRRTAGGGTFTPYNRNHDRVKLRIGNTGPDSLVINQLMFSSAGNWNIELVGNTPYDPQASLPLAIGPADSTELTVQFTAVDVASRVAVLHDTLYISSNDPDTPLKKIMLHGLWQRRGEGANEPYAQEIIDAFGFTSRTGYETTDAPINGEDIVPNSDETLVPFFMKLDASKPVTVTQLAAYHGCCASVESFRWYNKGTTSVSTLFTHHALDGQSLLPKVNGSSGALARGTFDPPAGTAFGFVVGGNYSDRTRNPGGKIGLRVWKAIDAEGNEIPGAYIIGGDYLGTSFTNYDYQDNVYYIENVQPETMPPPPPPLASETPGFLDSFGDLTLPEESTQRKLSAYPNPYPGQGRAMNVSVEHFDPSEEVTVSLLDFSGQLLESQTLRTDEEGNAVTEMQTSQVHAPGLYILQALAASGKANFMLVVQ